MKLGIDNIDKYLDYFAGKRVGLITNPTGISSNFKSTITILQEKVNLVALFSPEHGVRGNVQAGVNLEAYIDDQTGIIVHSLYGDNRKPTQEMLDSLDVLCIDIQDVGSRFYTYVYTMAYSMAACTEYQKDFIVFDRPNPINGVTFEGNILDLLYRSFIGYYPIPQRHGLTIGELASLFNKQYEINCNLKIIPMEGWDRRKYYDELELLWVAPSPNIPTVEATVTYNGTCIFEGTNISEGRGTTRPFEIIGAPFIKPDELAKKLNALGLKGVYFRPLYFSPTFSKHAGIMCGGVQVHVLSREAFQPVHTGWAMLDVIRRYPEFTVNKPYTEGGKKMLELNTGCDYIIEDKYNLKEQFAILDNDTKKFAEIRAKYLIY